MGGKGVASTKATIGRGETGVSTTGATTVGLGGTGTVQTSRLTHPQLETGVGDLSDEYMQGTIELRLCQTGGNEGVPRRGTHVRIVASGTTRLVFCARSA